MELTDNHRERDDKRTSAIVTAVATLLLLFMLMFPFFPPVMEDLESGIMVALGNIDTESSGEEIGAAPTESAEESETSTNDSQESSESASESEPIAAAEPSASAQKEVETAEQKESINLNKEKEDKAKADKAAADAKKQAEKEAKQKAEDAKKKAEAEAKKKAEEERKRKEKELADKKKELSDLLGGGNGNDSSSQGDEDGEPDKANLEGITTGTGDIGGGLSGRDVVSRPSITDKSQATGKVVVKVCVNAAGKVVSAKFTQKGTTATDLGLIKTAEKGVKSYEFSPGELDKQCGTITVNFKLK